MNKEDCYELGRITKVHGLKGEVQLLFEVDDPFEYEDLDSVLLEVKGQLIPYFIEDLNIQSNKIIAKFEDITSIEKATPLVGAKLWLTLDNLPELDDDQFYFHDVIGYQVVDTNVGPLGTVREFASFSLQDLMVMDYEGKEVLIPVIDEIIGEADHEAKTLSVTLPEGLLDIYMSEAKDADERDDADEEA
ncbi:16S rRNA processing protein RimM [Siphonobacter sp. BAB-5405]|uniref:ribosome maturation factor RimM n=1 Tax=Siphonobacter sp. BAB-5405 TaxID=1864825 RepID=UPI000C80771D|nr:ribosome maturation factor RimM [Siphonobacter sp. BAB-5405]PMD95603.1 16S rRNA processing protein RimM [Siphonobacter sp. BAB-5405]